MGIRDFFLLKYHMQTNFLGRPESHFSSLCGNKDMNTMSCPDFRRVSNMNIESLSTHAVSRNLLKYSRGDRESRHVPQHYE